MSLVLKLNLIGSILVFYFIPSLFLSIRIKAEIGKASIFSLLGIPAYILIETVGNVSNAWTVPTLFPFKLFGSSIEGALWGFFAIYLAVMFYEYFIDHHITKKLYGKNFKYFMILVLALFSIFILSLFGFPNFLRIPYAYSIIGLVFILIPILLELFSHHKFFTKFFIAAAYFFYFNFIYEITALTLRWGYFPVNGQFIGWIDLFGLMFPFEELFFFIMISVMAILSLFEFFDEDHK